MDNSDSQDVDQLPENGVSSKSSSTSSDRYHSAESTFGGSASQDLSRTLMDMFLQPMSTFYGSEPEGLWTPTQDFTTSPVCVSAPEELQTLPEVGTQSKRTCYGTESQEYWTPLVQNLVDEDSAQDDGSELQGLTIIDQSELEIDELIAEGGQGRVHLARWRSHDPEKVVVKMLKGGLNQNVNLSAWKLLKQLQQVIALGQLPAAHQHSGVEQICKVLGVCAKDNTETWIIMELMKGDLRSFLEFLKIYNVPLLDRMSMMYSIARGMETLHAAGLLHRDLKASNILLSLENVIQDDDEEKGNNHSGTGEQFHSQSIIKDVLGSVKWWLKVKFGDYERWLKVKIGDYESSEIGVMGTGFWRAPEVLRALGETTELTWKADVYSFGMLCYELLTGMVPFAGHPISDYNLILSGNRPELPSDLPEGVSKLLHRCGEPDPHQRPEFTEILDTLNSQCLLLFNSDQNTSQAAYMIYWDVYATLTLTPSITKYALSRMKP